MAKVAPFPDPTDAAFEAIEHATRVIQAAAAYTDDPDRLLHLHKRALACEQALANVTNFIGGCLDLSLVPEAWRPFMKEDR